MWWFEQRVIARAARLAAALAAASLVAGCWQPLYGTGPTVAADSVQDKLQQIDVPVIPAPKGQPAARLAVSLRNSLQYAFNGGAGANAPTYTLKIFVATSALSVIVDNTSGRHGARRLRYSGLGAALRQAARPARCRRPRRRRCRRDHPKPAGVVFRRRHLKPRFFSPSRLQHCGSAAYMNAATGFVQKACKGSA